MRNTSYIYFNFDEDKDYQRRKGSKVSSTSMTKLINKVYHINSSEDLRLVNIIKVLVAIHIILL